MDHPDFLRPPTVVGHCSGTLAWEDRDGGSWMLMGDPDLMDFARRLFPGSAVCRNYVRFADHPREVGDLCWLLQRFRVDLGAAAPRLEAARRAVIARWARRTAGTDLQPTVPPPTFRGRLLPYQQAGVTFLLSNQRCLLGDGMGLGKTWTALGAAAAADRWPVLVVCQPHVLRQWQRVVGALSASAGEGQQPLPFPAAVEARGAQLAPILRGLTPYAIPDTPYTLIHYGLLARWGEALRRRGYPVVIFDEAQELRHTGTAKYSAASLLSQQATYCWGLSGTPVYGYGAEIWSVINALDFHVLGSFDAFSREWCRGYGERMLAHPRALHAHLTREGLLLRRRSAEVAVQLPPVVRAVQDLAHDKDLYERLIGAARVKARQLQSVTHIGGWRQEWAQRGRTLREIETDTRRACGVAKARAAAAAVRGLVDQGERPLVYAWHHDVHDILQEQLGDLRPALCTGRETEAAKDRGIQRFQTGETPMVLLSLRSAAGLDGLQRRATCCVFAELDWAPAVHAQCIDEKTEILTDRGFVGPDDLTSEDMVAGFDLQSEEISFIPIRGIVIRKLTAGEKMYSIASTTVDLRVTGGHRMIFRPGLKKDGPWCVDTAERLAQRTQYYQIPTAGIQKTEGLDLLDDEIRLLGWYLTDGCLNRQSRQLSICQSIKSPFNRSIRSMLDGSLLQYGVCTATTVTNFGNTPRLIYYIPKIGPKRPNGKRGWMLLEPYLQKQMNEHYEKIDTRQLGIMLEAIHQGNGSKRKRQIDYDIGTGCKEFADHLQSLCIRRGWRANIKTIIRPSRKDYYNIRTKSIGIRSIGGTSCNDREIFSQCSSHVGERVWCVKNDLGTIIVRRNGKTAVVGNCETRIARMGVDAAVREVPSWYLVSRTGYDETVLDVLGVKRQQAVGLLGDDPEDQDEADAAQERLVGRLRALASQLAAGIA